MKSLPTQRELNAQVRSFPEKFDPASVKDWIRKICAGLEITPTELARRAQISHTTLSRFLAGRENSKHLSGTSLAALASVVNEAEAKGDLTVYRPSPPPKVTLKSDALKDEIEISRRGQYIGVMGIVRYIGKDIYQEIDNVEFYDPDLNLRIPIPTPIPHSFLKAYELREEGNRRYANGTILITSETAFIENLKSKATLLRLREVDGKVEGVIFELAKDPSNNWWMVPTWAKASAAEQIYIGENINDSVEALFGTLRVIITSIRPEV